jgi:hypothetical protein
MAGTVKLPSGKVISQEFYDKLISVTGKRARFVIDKITNDGSCSTEDLKDAGYEHAPRAKRDVVEAGVPIEVSNGVDRSGRRMAVYTFGDWEEYKKQNSLAKTKGRNNLTEKLKQKLIEENGSKCALYGEEFSENLLQTDHRVPFEIGGDPSDMMDTSKFMLLSPSANRAKSWACEHCENWTKKDISMCESCYYASPENYTHVAGTEERRVELIFRDKEIETYNIIAEDATNAGSTMQKAIKRYIAYAEQAQKKGSIK